MNLLDLGSGYTRAGRCSVIPDHGGDVAVAGTITLARKALLANTPPA
jgi:hypothetical protein